jgi:hypothetical protein
LITRRPLGHSSWIVADRTVRTVTDGAANSLASVRAGTAGRLLPIARRAVSVVIGLVGLIFVVVSIPLTVSEHWTLTTGTIQTCQSRIVRSPSSSTGHILQTCTVAWTDGGVRHSASVDFGQARLVNGQQTQVRVHGDSATAPSPGWAGPAVLAGGLVLVAAGVVEIRGRHRRARRAFAG